MSVQRTTLDRHSYLSIKLSLTSLAILSIVVSFYVYFSYLDLVAAIDHQYRERANSAITLANIEARDSRGSSRDAALMSLCRKLARIYPDVQNVSVYAFKQGKIVTVASSDAAQVGRQAGARYAAFIADDDPVWREEQSREYGHRVEIVAPLYAGGKADAALGIYMSLATKDYAVRQYVLRTLLYILAGLIALAPVLYVRFRKEIHSPVRKLIEGAQEVAQGNLATRINLERRDELGKLSKEFDTMTEAIQQREEETLSELAKIKEKWSEAEEKSRTDFLTELENKRSFNDRLEAELNRAARVHQPVSLLFCDLDDFKRFNDENGHLLGDRALFDTAEVIKFSIRNYDIAARYGGEEFVVILPGTNCADAAIVAERIRRNTELYEYAVKDGSGSLTVSVGIATFPSDAENSNDLIAAADHAMYESKRNGKNMVTPFNPSCSVDTTKAS